VSLTEDEIKVLAGGDPELITLYTASPKAAAAALARKKEKAPEPARREFDDELIPDIGLVTRPEDDGLDAAIEGIDILDAYRKWCGKMEPVVGSKRESIMISCPNPSHPDKNPSAWINLDKQVWACGGCGFEGGDKYDIAAWHFGEPVPGYKDAKRFPDLRRKMAADFGWVVRKTIGGTEYVEKAIEVVEEDELDEDTVTADIGDDDPIAAVVSLPSVEPETTEFDPGSTMFIDWETLLQEGTFMHDWMTAVTVDDLPHEYYFWLGLQALATAVGNNVRLNDFVPVKANLYVCLYGPTGSGKSRSMVPFRNLITEVMPWEGDSTTESNGTRFLPMPGSAEALLDSMRHEVEASGTMPIREVPTRTWLKIDEFSSFIARATRKGSSLKEILIELFDVLDGKVATHSRASGLTEVESPFFQITTTTQPSAIHAFLKVTDTESGFLNRWVFAGGTPRVERIGYGGVAPKLDLPAFSLKMIYDWAETPKLMSLEGDALKLWLDFFHGTVVARGATDSALASRIDLLLKKLIVLFTINEMEETPSVKAVEQAISLFEYLCASFILLGADITITDNQACQQDVIAYIKKHPKASGRDLHRFIKRWDTDQVIRALRDLIELGVIEEMVVKPKRGPSKKIYELKGA